MKNDCKCQYCKNKVDEYFCTRCLYNYNKCEVNYWCDGLTFCPKCYPKEEDKKVKIIPDNMEDNEVAYQFENILNYLYKENKLLDSPEITCEGKSVK